MPTLSSIIQPNNIVTSENEVTLTNKTIDSPVITVNGQSGNPRQPLVFDDNGSVTFGNGDSFSIPAGGTAARPAAPETGELRYNTDTGGLEQYDGTSWVSVVPDDIDLNTLSINGTQVVDSSGNIDTGSLSINGTEVIDSSSNITGTLVTAAQPNITTVGTLTNVIATNYNETVGTITSSDVDLSTGNVFEETISANTTYTFSNPPSSGTAFGFTLKITSSGTNTITWPNSVVWAGGSAPDAPASGETDVFVFYTTDGGTTYYGFQAGDALA